MITKNTQYAAFEALPENRKLNFSKVPDGSEYISFYTQLAWRDYKAATEAAKATSTAGEPEPEIRCFVRDGKAVHTPRRLEIIGEHIYEVPAARQPAPVAIKTWQERTNWQSDEPASKLIFEAAKAEIAELRAALAATAAPVVPLGLRSVERDTDKRVAFIFYDKQDADRFDADMRVSLAATRSQP